MPFLPQFSFRSRTLWACFLLISALALVLALRLMFLIDPGLNVDISFSREQALQAAADFQSRQFPQLQTSRQAAAFIKEQEFQNYIELEGGGLDAFEELIPQIDAHTHYWRVRSFRQGQKQELTTEFTPQGALSGFTYSLPDDEPGAILDAAAARQIAERGLQEFTGTRSGNYRLIESNETLQSGGRADHVFVYEHQLIQPGEAKIRLRVQVAGDQLTSVRLVKFIPEAFRKRFEEIRALNSQISMLANGMMIVIALSLLLGGALWLHGRHQLFWKHALACGFIVSIGMAAAQFCNLPASWMSYRTDTAEQSFLFQQLAQSVLIAVVAGFLFAAVYSVAEGLTRHAFAGQPRLWLTFHNQASASPEIAGRILGAYGWTGLFLLYAVLFVLFSTTVLGWWQPSTLPVDPNILASWRPALTPVFNALQAGTWEECFFRALPLAGAALLDRRFATGRKIVISMLFVQAVVFAAAHANYPQLPGYSRLVELFFPAMVFGLVYLRFGLLPCIITHFLYDLLLMSMPIFLSDAGGLWIDRVVILAAGFAPLLVVLYAWYRKKQLTPLPEELYNGVQPEPAATEAAPVAEATLQKPTHVTATPLRIPLSAALVLAALSAVILGLALMQERKPEWPEFSTDRNSAIHLAEQALQERGVQLQGEWHQTARILPANNLALRYVIEESGMETAQQLLGNYLITPFWDITWRLFDGPVEGRTEYWQVQVWADGKIRQVIHNLPEATPGASLNQQQAETLALDFLRNESGLQTISLEVKATTEVTRPARSDWTVRLLDKAAYQHEDASAAATVMINGDRIRSFGIGIDVPEEWMRQQNEENSSRQLYQILLGFLSMAVLGCALAPYFRRHSGRRFSVKAALPWILLAAFSLVTRELLQADNKFLAFKTGEDWQVQLMLQAGLLLLTVAVTGALIFLAAQAVHAERPYADRAQNSEFVIGMVLGLLLAALGFSGVFIPNQLPFAGSLDGYSTGWPVLFSIAGGINRLTSILIPLMLIRGLARFITTRSRFVLILALAAAAIVCNILRSPETGPAAMSSLMLVLPLSLVYLMMRHQQSGLALVMLGTMEAFRTLNGMHADYPSALLASVVNMTVVLLFTWVLHRNWYRHGTAPLVKTES